MKIELYPTEGQHKKGAHIYSETRKIGREMHQILTELEYFQSFLTIAEKVAQK